MKTQTTKKLLEDLCHGLKPDPITVEKLKQLVKEEVTKAVKEKSNQTKILKVKEWKKSLRGL